MTDSRGVTATILDGKAAAAAIKADLRARVDKLRARGIVPGPGTQGDVEAVVDELNAGPTCSGYIVQLPLLRGLDANAVLELVDPEKDADGLHPTNLGRLVLGRPAQPRFLAGWGR